MAALGPAPTAVRKRAMKVEELVLDFAGFYQDWRQAVLQEAQFFSGGGWNGIAES